MHFLSNLSLILTGIVISMGAPSNENSIHHYTPPMPKIIQDEPQKPNSLTWRFRKDGSLLSEFYYEITTPNPTNWVGIWHAYDGAPINGVKVKDPIARIETPDATGTAAFNSSRLLDGPYTAVLLKHDSYEQMLDPIGFHVGPMNPVNWLVPRFTTRSVHEGANFSLDVSRLVDIAGDPQNNFSTVYCRDTSWCRTKRNGVVYGVPPPGSHGLTQMGVEAKSRIGIYEFAVLDIPVKTPDEPLVDTLRVITMQLFHGEKYHVRQIEMILRSNADIVSLQGDNDRDGLHLAYTLGWWAHQTPSLAIISRYPIVETFNTTDRTTAVRIALDDDRQTVVVWAANLSPTFYGPKEICLGGHNATTVLKTEEASGRAPEARAIGSLLAPFVENSEKVPVVLAGNFFSASHLDWTEATRDTHCGVGSVQWPASLYPTAAGMCDSFRRVNRDPVAVPGYTWPRALTDAQRKRGEKLAVPKERTDFIYYAGALEPVDSTALRTHNYASVTTTFKLDNKMQTEGIDVRGKSEDGKNKSKKAKSGKARSGKLKSSMFRRWNKY